MPRIKMEHHQLSHVGSNVTSVLVHTPSPSTESSEMPEETGHNNNAMTTGAATPTSTITATTTTTTPGMEKDSPNNSPKSNDSSSSHLQHEMKKEINNNEIVLSENENGEPAVSVVKMEQDVVVVVGNTSPHTHVITEAPRSIPAAVIEADVKVPPMAHLASSIPTTAMELSTHSPHEVSSPNSLSTMVMPMQGSPEALVSHASTLMTTPTTSSIGGPELHQLEHAQIVAAGDEQQQQHQQQQQQQQQDLSWGHHSRVRVEYRHNSQEPEVDEDNHDDLMRMHPSLVAKSGSPSLYYPHGQLHGR